MIRTGEKKLAAYEKKTAEPPSTSSRLSVGVSIQSSATLPTTSNGIIQSISREHLVARTSGRGIYRLTVCRAYVRWSGYCPTWRPDGDSDGMTSRKKRAHARAPPKPKNPNGGRSQPWGFIGCGERFSDRTANDRKRATSEISEATRFKLRQNHRVDHVDDAVGCFDVGLHHI